MKLATLKNDQRDGKLVVVTPDLAWCTDVTHIEPTLQSALDNWACAIGRAEGQAGAKVAPAIVNWRLLRRPRVKVFDILHVVAVLFDKGHNLTD